MASKKISDLPLFTGDTDGIYFVINNSGQTQTFKVDKERIFLGFSDGTSGTSGSSGTSGTSGSSGTSGTSGSSGTSGTSFEKTGGTFNQVLLKNSSTDYDTTWANYIPTGGTANQILSKVDSTNYNTQWVNNATTFFQTTIPERINISSGVVDLISFTLPVIGTYKITFIIRSTVTDNATVGVVYMRNAANTNFNDTVLMPHFNSGVNAQGSGTMVHILTTTTINQTFKLSAYATGGGVMDIRNDFNGVSKLIWEKIG